MMPTPEAAVINPAAAQTRTQVARETARAAFKKTEAERVTKNAQRKKINPLRTLSGLRGLSRRIREDSLVGRAQARIEAIERRTGVQLTPDMDLSLQAIRQIRGRVPIARNAGVEGRLVQEVGQQTVNAARQTISDARARLTLISHDPLAALAAGEGIVLKSESGATLAPGAQELANAVKQVRREFEGSKVFVNGARVEARLKALIPNAQRAQVQHLLTEAGISTRDVAKGIIEQVREYRVHRVGTQNIDAYYNQFQAEVIANVANRARLEGNRNALINWLHNADGLSRVISRIPVAGDVRDVLLSSVRNGRLLVGAAVAVGIVTLPAHVPVTMTAVAVAAAIAATRHHMLQRANLQREVRAKVLEGWKPPTSTKDIRKASTLKINPFHIRDRLSTEYKQAQIYERVFKPLEAQNYILDTSTIASDISQLQTPAEQMAYLADLAARISLAQRGDVFFTLQQDQNGKPSLQTTLETLRTQRDYLINQLHPSRDAVQNAMVRRRAALLQIHAKAERNLHMDTVKNTVQYATTLVGMMAAGYEVGQGLHVVGEWVANSPVGEWFRNTPAAQWMGHNLGLRNIENAIKQHLPGAHHEAAAGHVNTHIVDIHTASGQDIKVNLPENMSIDPSNHLVYQGHQIGVLQNMTPDGHGGYSVTVHLTDSHFSLPNGHPDMTFDTSSGHPLNFQHDLSVDSSVKPDSNGNLQQPLSVTQNSQGGVTVTGTEGNGNMFNAMGFNVTDAHGVAHSMVVYGANGQIQYNPTDTHLSYFVSIDGQAPAKMTSAQICNYLHITSQTISGSPHVGGKIPGLFGHNATALHDSNIWSPSGKASELTRLGPTATQTISSPNLPVSRNLTLDLSSIGGGNGNAVPVNTPGQIGFGGDRGWVWAQTPIGGYGVGPMGVWGRGRLGQMVVAPWGGLGGAAALGVGAGVLRELRGKDIFSTHKSATPFGLNTHGWIRVSNEAWTTGGTILTSMITHNPALIPLAPILYPSYFVGKGIGRLAAKGGKLAAKPIQKARAARQAKQPTQQQQTRQQQRVQRAQTAVQVAAQNAQTQQGATPQTVLAATIRAAQQQRGIGAEDRVAAVLAAVPSLTPEQQAQVIVQAGNVHMRPRMSRGAMIALQTRILNMAQRYQPAGASHDQAVELITQEVVAEAYTRAAGRNASNAAVALLGPGANMTDVAQGLIPNNFTVNNLNDVMRDAQAVVRIMSPRIGRKPDFADTFIRQRQVARVRAYVSAVVQHNQANPTQPPQPITLENMLIQGGFVDEGRYPNAYQRGMMQQITHQRYSDSEWGRAFYPLATQQALGERAFAQLGQAYDPDVAETIVVEVVDGINRDYNLGGTADEVTIDWQHVPHGAEFAALGREVMGTSSSRRDFLVYNGFLATALGNINRMPSGATEAEIADAILGAYETVYPREPVQPTSPTNTHVPTPPPFRGQPSGPLPPLPPTPGAPRPRGRFFGTLAGATVGQLPGVWQRVQQIRASRTPTRPLNQPARQATPRPQRQRPQVGRMFSTLAGTVAGQAQRLGQAWQQRGQNRTATTRQPVASQPSAPQYPPSYASQPSQPSYPAPSQVPFQPFAPAESSPRTPVPSQPQRVEATLPRPLSVEERKNAALNRLTTELNVAQDTYDQLDQAFQQGLVSQQELETGYNQLMEDESLFVLGALANNFSAERALGEIFPQDFLERQVGQQTRMQAVQVELAEITSLDTVSEQGNRMKDLIMRLNTEYYNESQPAQTQTAPAPSDTPLGGEPLESAMPIEPGDESQHTAVPQRDQVPTVPVDTSATPLPMPAEPTEFEPPLPPYDETFASAAPQSQTEQLNEETAPEPLQHVDTATQVHPDRQSTLDQQDVLPEELTFSRDLPYSEEDAEAFNERLFLAIQQNQMGDIEGVFREAHTQIHDDLITDIGLSFYDSELPSDFPNDSLGRLAQSMADRAQRAVEAARANPNSPLEETLNEIADSSIAQASIPEDDMYAVGRETRSALYRYAIQEDAATQFLAILDHASTQIVPQLPLDQRDRRQLIVMQISMNEEIRTNPPVNMTEDFADARNGSLNMIVNNIGLVIYDTDQIPPDYASSPVRTEVQEVLTRASEVIQESFINEDFPLQQRLDELAASLRTQLVNARVVEEDNSDRIEEEIKINLYRFAGIEWIINNIEQNIRNTRS